MSIRKLCSVGLLVAVSIVSAAGACCLELLVLSSPAENNGSPSLKPLPLIASPDQAALVFDEPEVDLGAVKEKASHCFTYRNASAKPLKIIKIGPSCSCAVSEPDRTTLQPEESGSITMEANVSQKEPGAHRFLLFVEYESAGHKATATAALRVVHQPDLYITPRYANITVTEGTRATTNITIIDYRKESLKILKLHTSSPALEAKISASPSEYSPGWHHVIAAIYSDPSQETRLEFQERILIETSDSELPLLTIPVEVRRLERLRLAPQAVVLQPGRPAEVILRDSLGQMVAIAECETNGLAELSFIKKEETAKKISLSLPRERVDSSKYPATIWIRVGKPCERLLPIRVSLASRKGS